MVLKGLNSLRLNNSMCFIIVIYSENLAIFFINSGFVLIINHENQEKIELF